MQIQHMSIAMNRTWLSLTHKRTCLIGLNHTITREAKQQNQRQRKSYFNPWMSMPTSVADTWQTFAFLWSASRCHLPKKIIMFFIG